MELNFKQNEQLNYEVEFKVEDVFNIHIEKSNKGPIQILQKSTPKGNYAKSATIDCDEIFNYDINCLVYPKYIKIISGSPVQYAEVLSGGNITI